MEESATVEVVVGRVGRAHGLRGDVVVEVRTDEPDARFGVGATVQIEGSRRDLTGPAGPRAALSSLLTK